MRISLRLGAIVPLAVLSGFAAADVAFNDYGSANGGLDYNTSVGWTVSSSLSVPGLSEFAQQFVAGAGGTVSDVILPMNMALGSGTVLIQLMNDNAGAVGTTVMESWSMNTTGMFGSWNMPATLTGDGSASLALGTDYWLVATVENDTTSNLWSAWNFNNTGVDLTEATNSGAGYTYSNNAAAAFSVDVTPSGSPEPFTLALGLGGLAIALRRRMVRA